MDKIINYDELNEKDLNEFSIEKLIKIKNDLQNKFTAKELNETNVEEYKKDINKQKKLINKYTKFKENNQLEKYKKEYELKKIELLKKKEELEKLENKIKKNDKSFGKNKSNNISIKRLNRKELIKKNKKNPQNKSCNIINNNYYEKISDNKEIKTLFETNKKKINEVKILINELNENLNKNKNSIDNIYLNGLIKNYEEKMLKIYKKYDNDLINYMNNYK